MKITWFAHAAFLLEGNGLRIITDPYKPEVTGFRPILEPADIVIRSSADDEGHCYAAMIQGNPQVVTATELCGVPHQVGPVSVAAIPAQESLIHKDSPRDNAMYRFTLDGIRVAHFGDVGNRLTDAQLEALTGTEVLLAPAGGPPTIDLDDLCEAISAIRPAVVIPMHYQLPGLKADLFGVSEFAARFPAQSVVWNEGPTIEFSREALPSSPMVVVLAPSTT